MLKYVLKRLGLSIIILLGVSMIIYFLVRLMPVDFVMRRLSEMNQGGATISQETIEEMYKRYGLSDSSFFGILNGYASWLWHLCHFDFGVSFRGGGEVIQEIATHMPVSFAVAFISIIFEYMIAIPLGVTAATHQYSIRDYVVTILVMVGISLPSFFLGRALQHSLGFISLGNGEVLFYPNGLKYAGSTLNFFDQLIDYLKHLTLPILSTIILGVGGTMRYMRTNMLEVLNSDYIRTARAKGLKETKVIYKHAFRNTMIPIVTMMAGVLPSLFSGAMITEDVFDLPGIGEWALKATQAGDIPVIMTYNMFLALLSVIGVLLSDLMYVVVDPRVKLS